MSNIISGSDIAANLLSYFERLVEEVKTSKTARYVTSQEGFKKRMKDVVDTIVQLMACQGSTVSVNGVNFAISDYKVPAKLEPLVNAGRIFASADAIGRVEPIFEVESHNTLISPESFNRFFADFNANQTDETSIKLSEGLVRRTYTLDDVQYIEDEDGMMCKLHETGFDMELCTLLGLKIDALGKYLTKYSKPSELGMALWLLK